MSSHQEIIGKGMLRFIVLRGVLGWGVTTAFIVQIIMSLTSDKGFFDGFITSLIAFPLGRYYLRVRHLDDDAEQV